MPHGVAAGDVGGGRAVIWSRADRAGADVRRVRDDRALRRIRAACRGPAALETIRLHRARRPHRSAGRPAHLLSRALPGSRRPPDAGASRSPAASRRRRRDAPRDVTLAWSADTVGQGWGINPEWGGLRLYETMRRGAARRLHPLSATRSTPTSRSPPEVKLDDGTHLEERRDRGQVEGGRDAGRLPRLLPVQPARRAHAALQRRGAADRDVGRPRGARQLVLGARPDDATRGITEKSVALLAARARQAFLEYNPIADRRRRSRPDLPHRSRTGPLVEVFALDMRSYRGREPREPADRRSTPRRRCSGAAQLAMAEGSGSPPAARRGRSSPATCRSASSCATAPSFYEAVANGDAGRAARPRARDRRPAALHQASSRIRNVVWITGDVHYCAAHHYDPARAKFTEFDPFWEFVAGPLNAGTFGPSALDATFGPEVKFIGIPPGMKPNRPPSDGLPVLRHADDRREDARADRAAARSLRQDRSTPSTCRPRADAANQITPGSVILRVATCRVADGRNWEVVGNGNGRSGMGDRG